MIRKIVNLTMIVTSILALTYQVYGLGMNILGFPETRSTDNFWDINLAASILFSFILTRKALFIKAHIISALDLLLFVLNHWLFKIFCLIGQAYVKTVTAKENLIEFVYTGAVNSVKIILVTVIAVLFLLWLKYITAVYHNLKELGGG